MKAAAGSVVQIYVDSMRNIQVGECLVTDTGRSYQIIEMRVQAKGVHVGRKHIRAIVFDQAPRGVITHPLRWYRRNKKRVR